MGSGNYFKGLLLLLMIGLLAACGGGGSGSDSDGTTGNPVTTTGITTGIAVDPYIVNAQFEEVAADGSIIQRNSSSSDALGRFTFANDLADGSVIQMKIAAQGQHAGAPYAGVIKRHVVLGDAEPVIVSPLTTLVANGMSSTAVVQMMQSAGLGGLTEASLYADPMAALANRTGTVSDADLVPLQANMAAHSYMEAIGNFNYNGTTAAAGSPVNFADIVAMVKETLNPTLFQQLISSFGADFTVGDMANTAVSICRTVVNEIKEETAAGSVAISPATMDQFMSNAMADATTIAGQFYQSRTGNMMGGGTTAPGTGSGGGGTPPPTSALDGQAIFAAKCSGCHTFGTGTGIMDLAGDGAKVSTKFGNGASHNGRTLTADEIVAVAAYFNSQGGTTDPGTGSGGGGTAPTGSELYATECQGCHGSLQTSTVNDRMAAGIQAAIDADLGGMGALTLTASEIQAIADALAATTTPPSGPPQDRTGQQVYDQECAICHALGSHDSSGAIDLAGQGAAIITKIQGGHNNKVLSSAELTALADFADTFAPPPGGGGTTACDSCHGQPPSGSSFPNTAGAHGVHTALNEVGTTCDNCHSGAAHNSWVDLGFPAKWNAESGSAADNMDGTCANIICHGGQKTPVWGTGLINVDTQCRSCHVYGTTQYNGYYSGRHQKHVIEKGYDCLNCHDAAKLKSGHFGNLSTTAFELAPAATIKGALSYSNGTCQTPGCHGSKNW